MGAKAFVGVVQSTRDRSSDVRVRRGDATTTIDNFLASAAAWMSGLSANSFTDFLQGALLLVRHTLSGWTIQTGLAARVATTDCSDADLAGASLTAGPFLPGADLTDADLTGADLIVAILTRAA